MRESSRVSERHQEILQAMEEALPALRAFARGLCLDRISADDLVQAACARALERLDQVTDLSGMRSWLNRIVYTQWQDTLRRRWRRKRNIIEMSRYWQSIEESKHKQEERARVARLDIEQALTCLDSDARAAVVLVGMLGYSYQEAALVLELPAGTVASRVARARSRMADFLTTDRRQGNQVLMAQSKRQKGADEQAG